MKSSCQECAHEIVLGQLLPSLQSGGNNTSLLYRVVVKNFVLMNMSTLNNPKILYIISCKIHTPQNTRMLPFRMFWFSRCWIHPLLTAMHLLLQNVTDWWWPGSWLVPSAQRDCRLTFPIASWQIALGITPEISEELFCWFLLFDFWNGGYKNNRPWLFTLSAALLSWGRWTPWTCSLVSQGKCVGTIFFVIWVNGRVVISIRAMANPPLPGHIPDSPPPPNSLKTLQEIF